MRRPTITRIGKNRQPMKTLSRGFGGMGIGSFLLDGGDGGQSSYSSIKDYENTTGVDIKGNGLVDKIGRRLSKINIKSDIPRKKNITMNF